MTNMTENKRERLDSVINDLNSFVVGFSGGVDSSYLLLRAHTLLKDKIMGLTIRTPYMPLSETEEAVEFARVHGINHRIIELPFPDQIRSNPPSVIWSVLQLKTVSDMWPTDPIQMTPALTGRACGLSAKWV